MSIEEFKNIVTKSKKDDNHHPFTEILLESLELSFGKEKVKEYIEYNTSLSDDNYCNNLIESTIYSINNDKTFDYYYKYYIPYLMYIYFSSKDKTVGEVAYLDFLYEKLNDKVRVKRNLKRLLDQTFLNIKTKIMLDQAVERKNKRR